MYQRIEQRMHRRLGNLWTFVTFNYETKIGFLIVSIFVGSAILVAVFGDRILPYNPLATVGKTFLPPTFTHPFGTEDFGRDMLSRVIAGTPNDALVSFCVVGFSFFVGGVFGSTAGFRGGILDEILMRLTDIFFVIPGLILAIVIVSVLGPSVLNLTFALTVLWWPPYARIARSEALKLTNSSFVESAKLSGLSSSRILFRHIFRIASATLLTYATFDIGMVVLAYSGLAYLGFSVSPPAPDWGLMVAEYQQYIILYPWLPLIPAAVIVIVTIGFALLGDGLKVALQRERGL